MADYWVSQQRHWCKYCKKFIANNKPSIQIHETGLAHKNQVERFLREIYKKGKDEKKTAESVRRELQRIDKAALASYHSKDSGNEQPGNTSTTQSGVSSSSQPKPAASTARTGFEGYGIGDYDTPTVPPEPVTTHLMGRDEWAIKKGVAQPGEWETVVPESWDTPSHATSEEQPQPQSQRPSFLPEDDEEEEDLSQFKIREKEQPAMDTPLSSVFKKRKLKTGSAKHTRKREEHDGYGE
ncbi:hypothetical protein BDF14DRAFT_1834958 [Spinellus fusiger]|nr:hypothetical protein BDF14DRAFT_1834958 [Spinellus fusiger]